jgi:alcohol dehydrogenase (NADP+)
MQHDPNAPCPLGLNVSESMEYRNALAGSNTGGIQETQDVVNFCALNKIKPEITKIAMNGIDDAWKKVYDKQARYRFVIDMGAQRS